MNATSICSLYELCKLGCLTHSGTFTFCSWQKNADLAATKSLALCHLGGVERIVFSLLNYK